MTIKLGKMATYFEGFLPIMSLEPLITWSGKIMWQIKTITTPLLQSLWPPNWQDDSLPWGPPTGQIKTIISLLKESMSTKPGRTVNYRKGLLPIQSHDPLITWSSKIMWQTKTNIFPLSQCLWPPNLTGWWHTMRCSEPLHHMILPSRILWGNVTC